MSAQEMDAEKAFERFEGLLRDWLRDSGGTRIDIDYHAIHRTGHVINWLTIDGQRKSVLFPAKMDFTMYKLRPAQVDPHRGCLDILAPVDGGLGRCAASGIGLDA